MEASQTSPAVAPVQAAVNSSGAAPAPCGAIPTMPVPTLVVFAGEAWPPTETPPVAPPDAPPIALIAPRFGAPPAVWFNVPGLPGSAPTVAPVSVLGAPPIPAATPPVLGTPPLPAA